MLQISTRDWRARMGMQMLRTMLSILCVTARAANAGSADVPQYSVSLDAQSAQARVTLCLAKAHAAVEFAADSPRAMRFASDVRRSGGGRLTTLRAAWRAADWQAGECLAYTADLAAIADLHTDAGSRFGDVLVTDPQVWLLHVEAPHIASPQLSIELPEGWAIAAPWHELAGADKARRFRIAGTPRDWSASVAIGRFEERQIALPGGTVHMAILFDADQTQRKKMADWIQHAAEAVSQTYGRMPLKEVTVDIVSIHDTSFASRFFSLLYPAAVFGGESTRGQGNGIQLVVDPNRAAAEFRKDWTAVHELSHLMHPYLGDRGSWLSEGLATYYQHVLRARSGVISAENAWGNLAEGFQHGASAGDDGVTLENAASSMSESHAFQRVYSAGAAYWLTVDADIRRTSGGALNLDIALSRFADCCLPSYREWTPEDFVARLDELLQMRVASRRYREFAKMTGFPDWQGVYARLGVITKGDEIVFDDNAADASIRKAIISVH